MTRIWRGLKKGVHVEWIGTHQIWMATDDARPGCSAVHTNRTKLRTAMREAQAAWDEARAQCALGECVSPTLCNDFSACDAKLMRAEITQK